MPNAISDNRDNLEDSIYDLQASIGMVFSELTNNGTVTEEVMSQRDRIIFAAMKECYAAYEKADRAYHTEAEPCRAVVRDTKH